MTQENNSHLFSWDEIPGNDSIRLIDFLIKKFSVDWVKTAKIEKIDHDKTIRVSTEKNLLFLKLINEKTKLSILIDDGRTDEFTANTENDEVNIYSNFNTLYVPTFIKVAEDNRIKLQIVKNIKKDDKNFKAFLNSMPGNYFSLFSLQQITEHYNFIEMNKQGKFGILSDETNIEIRDPKYILTICKKDLSDFLTLINKIEMTNRHVVHHHSFIPKSKDFNFQIVLVQTTDEHFRPELLNKDKIKLNKEKIEQILEIEMTLETRILENGYLKKCDGDKIKRTLRDIIDSGLLGNRDDVMEILSETFLPNMNIAYEKGIDQGKIAELIVLYIQLILKKIDSLCYIRQTDNGLYRVNCFGKSPSYMKSQGYLPFLTERLHYYQTLNKQINFDFRGGYSNFIKSSGKEQIEMPVFYLKFEGNDDADIEKNLALDLADKVVPRFNELSLFDIMGPRMVGPSSSHTAGANRLGRLSRNIIIAGIKSGKLNSDPLYLTGNLYKSFKLTGPGHGTLNAFLGGLRGDYQYNENITNENTDPIIVKEGEIENKKLVWSGYLEEDFLEGDYHENSVLLMVNDYDSVSNLKDALFYIVGESYGGGNVQIREVGGRIAPQKISFDTKARDKFTGKQAEKLPEIFGDFEIYRIFEYPPCEGRGMPENIKRPRVVILDDILWYCRRTGKTISQIALEYECITQKIIDDSIIFSELKSTYDVMNEAVSRGIKNDQIKGEFYGGDGVLLNNYANRHSRYSEELFLKASAYAIGVSEQNAAHKLIVAAPTAGACGIIPGVLVALDETYKFSIGEIYDGLLTGAFIGLVINNIVPTSGATHGCQAETGIGCAMAAAMATNMLGGSTEEIINATALALKNSFGLVCDPIAGKVEIPCIKRNGFKAVEALIAAKMALSGIKSAVPAGEIVKAMDEIGKNMKSNYRETSCGGLAVTIRGRDESRSKNHCGSCCK